jgi:hypothetical protein
MAFTAVAVGSLLVAAGSAAYSAWKNGEISDEQFEKTKEALRKYQDSLQAPPGTAPKFTPEEFASIQQFSPQIAQHVEEKSPEMLTEAKSGAAIRAQNEGLQDLRSRVMSGKDVIADAQQEEALFNADAQAKGRREQILQSMSNRGLSGSGQDILAQLGSSQQAQVNARQQSLDAAKQAEGRRMEALGQMTNLAGNIRGQNRQTEANNADIMNSYNQRLAAGQNAHNQYAAGVNNAAQQYNIGNKTQVDQANVNQRNQANYGNQMRQFNQEQAVRDFNNDKAAKILGAETKTSQMAAEGAKQNVGNWTGVATGIASGVGQVAAGMNANEQRQLDRDAYGGKTRLALEEDPILKNARR